MLLFSVPVHKHKLEPVPMVWKLALAVVLWALVWALALPRVLQLKELRLRLRLLLRRSRREAPFLVHRLSTQPLAPAQPPRPLRQPPLLHVTLLDNFPPHPATGAQLASARCWRVRQTRCTVSVTNWRTSPT